VSTLPCSRQFLALGLLAVFGGGAGCAPRDDPVVDPADCRGVSCPPSAPRCYSPCRDHLLRADGTLVRCSAEGLLEGCLGDNVCVSGSCRPPQGQGALTVSGVGQVLPRGDPLAAGQPDPTYPACRTDSHCPDFQTCLAGQCFSNCTDDADCPAATRCHRHVCRTPCHLETAPCQAADQVCLAEDGENGFCMPQSPGAGPGEELFPPGGFTLDRRLLSFSGVQTAGSFFLTNESPTTETFVLRKVEHTEYPAAGPLTVREQPLSWLQLGTAGERSRATEVSVTLPPWSEQELFVAEAVNPDKPLPRWDGLLEVTHPRFGTHRLRLAFSAAAAGRWSGTMVRFASFRDVGLDEYLATGSADRVENALLQFWDEFKRGQRGFELLLGVLRATASESWRDPALAELGPCGGSSVACIPWDNDDGYVVYTQELEHRPIPTGGVEIPFVVHLREEGSPSTLVGRIPTDEVLQYGGDPEVRLELGADPARAVPTAAGVVVTPVIRFDSRVLVGGRFLLTGPDDPRCATYAEGSYGVFAIPWLVEGFLGSSREGEGQRYRDECRDTRLPRDPAGGGDVAALNAGAAGANPIPDGRTRVRELSLVDGALVNQQTLVLIVRERFLSFLGADDAAGFSAYSVLVLNRSEAELEDADYVGSPGIDERPFADDLLLTGCDAALLARLDEVSGRAFDPDDPSQADDLVGLVLDGVADPAAAVPLGPADDLSVHWYCEDTGILDGLVRRGGQDVVVPCPESSRVRYFLTDGTVGRTGQGRHGEPVADVDHPCEDLLEFADIGDRVGEVGDGFEDSVTIQVAARGTCWQTLQGWQQEGQHGIQLDPRWRCAGEREVRCDRDRFDLRTGKLFYPRACLDEEGCLPGSTPAFVPAASLLQDAFRYKTRFRSRRGENPGFVPAICPPGSDAVPYCYDPAQIEELASRVDCLLSLYTRHRERLAAPRAQALREFLAATFATTEVTDAFNRTTTYDGFERLYAELLILLGDEAYTAALASRFDLAGQAQRTFPGDLCEPPDGLVLAGGAGHELSSLYRATQLYQLALDRFYAHGPLLWQELARAAREPDQPSFVTLATVTSYFAKLTRASTQKARAWSEIGRRYQGFQRADLARRVVARASTATFLESVVLSRMMLGLHSVVRLSEWPQVSRQLEEAQLGYRAALLAMSEVHRSFTDEQTVFGFAPDFVPFPALDPLDVNAVEKLLRLARDRVATAAAAEARALAASREFEPDAAAFQSQLVAIRQGYEDRLAGLCGTLQSPDGKVYPAIRRYAALHPDLAPLDASPCGFLEGGEVHGALAEVAAAGLRLLQVRDDIASLLAEVEIERQRVARQCALIQERADYVYTRDASRSALQATLDLADRSLAALTRAEKHIEAVLSLSKCTIRASVGYVGTGYVGTVSYSVKSNCFSQLAQGLALGAILAGGELQHVGLEAVQLGAQQGIAALETEKARWLTEHECDVAQVDGDATTRTLLLNLSHLTLDAARLGQQLALAEGRARSLLDEAQRLEQEQQETARLAIDAAAARSDPNVRIYRNDAVLAADRTFAAALTTLYQATRVFEYHTGTSFAGRQGLFTARMVAAGDSPLEAYLAGLSRAYHEFEEQHGNPDLRVAVLSLRDDLLAIPRLDEQGLPLTDQQRTARLRAKLTDGSLLDGRGYLVVPFATDLDSLSPLTRLHKVHHVEAQLLGDEQGDSLARVYLRQNGTGVLRDLDGGKQYPLLPERTAVIDVIVGEQRVFDGNLFDGDVYLNRRLRDRPLVNKGWELVLNLRDEAVNADLRPGALDDLRLYVYYTDFTRL